MSALFRVVLTASRSAKDTTLWVGEPGSEPRTLDGVLDGVAHSAASAGFLGLKVVHGACYPRADELTGRRPMESGDWLAELWVRDRSKRGWPVRSEPHPANWERYRRTAGHRRNADMVYLGGDLCVAFVDVCQKPACEDGPEPHGSHGAAGCARLAEGAGIHVQTFHPLDSALLSPVPSPIESETRHA